MQYTLPYGKTSQTITIPNDYSVEYISGKNDDPTPLFNALVKQAFDHPLNSLKLCDLVGSGDTVVIVVDDHTRPCPSKQLLPIVLGELKKGGVSDSDITILIGTGTHSPPTPDQIIQLLGKQIVHNYNVISNDNKNSSYVSIGSSSFDHDIKIHKTYIDADVKIVISDIEYHYFAGYGGTRKSILPGIASAETIQQNHAMMFNEYATTGELRRNPISIEMQEAFDLAGCDFMIGAVLNQTHDIVGLWTGDAKQVMSKGVKLVDSLFTKKISKKPDVIITAADGSPHDINLYQALKAVHTASKVINEDGIIMLAAECAEGMGNKVYQEWLKTYSTAEEIKQALLKKFIIGAHKAYYHRKIIERNTVYLSSSFNPSFVKKNLGFIPVENLEDSFYNLVSSKRDINNVLIVPKGSTTRLVF
ncbi:MAG: nickel-dependent lactate racemase [Candidatus Thermoplasmatota archaeon]|nr:nickel-dependent lactate racemase [Candidatus Thermoplasmatota archaeon]